MIGLTVLPKVTERVSAIPFRIPAGFFVETDKVILKCM